MNIMKTLEETILFEGLSGNWVQVEILLRRCLPGELAEMQRVITQIDMIIEEIKS